MRNNIFPAVEALALLTAPPWEYQIWDTPRSYTLFAKYYLALPPEKRTLTGAYRSYRAESGQNQGKKIVGVPGQWQHYHDGLDPRGQRPAGSVYEHALTWAQRALLRDIDIEKKAQLALEQEIIAFRRKEIDLGRRLLERAEEMLLAPVYVQEVQDDGKVIVIKPADWSEADIARTAAAGSKLARLGYEMETERVTVGDWREKLVGAGMDPGEFIQVVVRALATGNAQD